MRDVNRVEPLITDSYEAGSGGAKAGHGAVLSSGKVVLAGANARIVGVFAHDAEEGEAVQVYTVGQVPIIANGDSTEIVKDDKLTTAAGGVFVKITSASGQISSVTAINGADDDGLMISCFVNALEAPLVT